MDAGSIDVQTRQRVEALARANRARLARAEVKRRIADGEVSAAEVILRHPRDVERMPVADVLVSQRQWGEVRCRRLLNAAGLPASKSIGSMTERQRLALAAQLGAGTTSQQTYPARRGTGAAQ